MLVLSDSCARIRAHIPPTENREGACDIPFGTCPLFLNNYLANSTAGGGSGNTPSPSNCSSGGGDAVIDDSAQLGTPAGSTNLVRADASTGDESK